MAAWWKRLRNTAERALEHWPIKVTALVLAFVLWAATTTQEPITQVVPVQLVVEAPPGRVVLQPVPQVRALFAGSLRELIKLYAQPPVIQKRIPDTVMGGEYTLELSSSDLSGYGDADVRPEDVQPRFVTVSLDAALQRRVPVRPRVSIVPDSGYALYRDLVVRPGSVLVRGPEARVKDLPTVYTVPLRLDNVREPVVRTVAIDTSGLFPVLVSHAQVEVTADVGPVAERLLNGVAVRVRQPARGAWVAEPESVTVLLRGPPNRVNALTPDSIEVVADAAGSNGGGPVAVSVTAPAGVSAQARPDSVTVRRRRG